VSTVDERVIAVIRKQQLHTKGSIGLYGEL
jgi:hypothetical protein